MNCPHCGQPVTLALIGGTASTSPAAASGPRPAGTTGLGPLCPVHGEAFRESTNPQYAGQFFCPVRGCRERPPR